MDKEEVAHFEAVLESFIEYGLCMGLEGARRRRARELLSRRFPGIPDGTAALEAFCKGAELNAQFLEEVVMSQGVFPWEVLRDVMRSTGKALHALHPSRAPLHERTAATAEDIADAAAALQSSAHDQGKVHGTLHSLAREWSAEGREEREECFAPLLRALQEHLPAERGSARPRVLIPGVGLGRLALEVAALGYSAQGNEFSYQMLLVSQVMLNSSAGRTFPVSPWLDQSCNEAAAGRNARVLRVPDVDPGERLSLSNEEEAGKAGAEAEESLPPLSMTAGEFLRVYAAQRDCWDCVLCCFFLDTASAFPDYLSAVRRLLRPGGLLVSLGPLLWHWAPALPGFPRAGADPRCGESVEMGWDEVRALIVAAGFVFLEEERVAAHYTRNPASLMATEYTAIKFVARLEV